MGFMHGGNIFGLFRSHRGSATANEAALEVLIYIM